MALPNVVVPSLRCPYIIQHFGVSTIHSYTSTATIDMAKKGKLYVTDTIFKNYIMIDRPVLCNEFREKCNTLLVNLVNENHKLCNISNLHKINASACSPFIHIIHYQPNNNCQIVVFVICRQQNWIFISINCPITFSTTHFCHAVTNSVNNMKL
jgi:hypothetical protein